MTTYNTGNSIGSADPRDLYDNAQVIDDYANSEAGTTSDRLGVERRTLAGMNNEYATDKTSRDTTFDADQADRVQRFNALLAASGYVFLADYAAGIVVSEYNEVIRDTAGNLWRASAGTDLPYTTTGAGLPEGGAFVSAGDAVLRNDLAAGVAIGQGALLVRGSVIYVDTIADLQALPVGELVDGQQVQVKEYHAGTGVGGGGFYWDVASTEGENGGTVFVGSGGGRWKRISSSVLDISCFGAQHNTDISTQLINAIEWANSIGGGVITAKGRYLVEQSIPINYDNIVILGHGTQETEFVRTLTAPSGFMFQWAANNNTEGGGISHCKITGVTNPDTGNGGVAFGTAINYANKWHSRNILCDSWGQYGYAIYNGNSWNCSKIRVTNHGHTTTAISSCMAFNIYPKLISSHGRLHDVYAVISPDSVANSAAIKLQTHANLNATKIFAKGGTEQCLNIDSVSGIISGAVARAVTANAGLIIGNYNTAHSFRGEFVLENVDCDDAGFSQSFVIGALAETDTEPKLKNCAIRNVKCRFFSALNRSAWQNTVFENIHSSSNIRIDPEQSGFAVPTVASTGNTYKNLTSKGTLDIRSSSSEFYSMGSRGGSRTGIRGGENMVNGWSVIDSPSNAFVLNGDNNVISSYLSIRAAGRSAWVQSGDNNVFEGLTVGGAGFLNNGTNTNTTGLTQV